jgi:hypothetical protein
VSLPFIDFHPLCTRQNLYLNWWPLAPGNKIA